MANSATVGILRVLLTGNSAELEAAYKRSTSATKSFLNELKAVQKESQDAGKAVSTALGKALDDAEKGVKGFLTAARQLSGIDLVGQANAYAKAVEAVGGASKLTREEQERVNAVLTQALAKYQALGREAPASLQKLAKETANLEQPTSKLSGWFGDLGNQVKASALGFISAQAVIGAVQTGFQALTGFVSDSVKAYAEAEAAQKRMTTALSAAGRATPAVIEDFNNLATQFQSTTVYSDDLINEMEALLTQVGDVAPGQMEKALTAATDLASGLGIDLRTATMLVGKAFEGETGTLKKYGIVIDEAKLKTEGADAVLDAIQKKFGGQAQAELDTYAGKVKQLANNWNNLQEEVGKHIAQDPTLNFLLRETNKALEDTNSASGKNVGTIKGWVFALNSGGFFDALIHWKELLDQLAEAANQLDTNQRKAFDSRPKLDTGNLLSSGLTAQQAAEAKKVFEDQIKTWTEADKALKAHLETIKRLREELSGRNLKQAVADLAEAFRDESKAGALGKEALENFAKAADDLRKKGATLTPELFKLALVNGLISASIGPVVDGLEKMGPAWEVTTDDMKETLKIIENLIPRLDVKDGLPAGFAMVGATAKMTDKELEKLIGTGKKWEDNLDDLARAMSQLAQVSDGAMSTVVRSIATIVAAWDAASKSAKAYREAQTGAQKAIAAITGIAAVLQATSQGSTIARAAGGALTGFEIGDAIAPGIGGIIGGIGGAVTGLLRGLFKGGTAGRDLVTQFAASLGGFDALHKKLGELGADGERLWVSLTQGVGRNNPQQAQAAIDAIKTALDKADKSTAKFNDDLGGTLTKIRDLGGSIPAALQPYIDKLRESGRLTQDNLDLLAQIASSGAPSWQSVEEAVNRYGGSIEKIGGSFQAARLHDSWQQVIDDLTLFTNANIAENDILELTKGKISELVQQSIKFGTEIPENMRPWIEKLAESGELLDENGDKITDISKLKFGETLQTTLEKLNKTLELLLKNILGIKPAIDGVPKSVDIDVNYHEGKFPDVSGIRAPTDREGNPLPEDQIPDNYRFAGGGEVGVEYAAMGKTIARVLPFPGRPSGTDTIPTWTSPGERVLTMPQNDWLRGAMAATANELSRASFVNATALSALQHGALAPTGTDGIGPISIHVPPGELYRALRDGTPIVVEAINQNHLGSKTQLEGRSRVVGGF